MDQYIQLLGKMKKSGRKSARKSAKKSNPKSQKACAARHMMWLKKSSNKKSHCRKKHNSRK